MTRAAAALLVLFVLAASSRTAHAQTSYRRYAPPSGPVLPYYLDYFRPQSGVLDQYNQFVAPKAQFANNFGQFSQAQSTQFQSMEGQIQKNANQIRASQAAPTGTHGGFMNYSHYFGRAGAAGAGSSQQQRTPSRVSFGSGAFGGNLGNLGLNR